ncbi:MAG: polysaccharide export protein [Verrucomicrobia bacterium]|nr:polysaccharide export protein [Verrucomicrobiota bacterium]
MATMKLLRKLSGQWILLCPLFLAGLLFSGCQTETPSADPFSEVPAADTPPAENAVPTPTPAAPSSAAPSVRLRVGDSLTITYQDAPTKMDPYVGRVKDDGSITISPYNRTFIAAGKNVRELEKEIHDLYVPQYFRNLTVVITTETLFFTVDGEVKTPNRFGYAGQMTVLQAIATAGGFTDYAKKTKVQITRADGKTKETVNCTKAIAHPELDLPIYPGDKIYVPRRLF